MLLQVAMNRLKVIRPHHLGFCFFWAISFAMLSGFEPGVSSSESYELFTIIKQAIQGLLPIAILFVYRKKTTSLPHTLVPVAGILLALGSGLFFVHQLALNDTSALPIVSALCIAAANILFFLFWQMFYASEGSTSASICIPISAVLSTIIYIFISQLDPLALAVVTSLLLPLAATYTLKRSLSEIEPFVVVPFGKIETKTAFTQLWRPVFCVVIIGFIWRLVSSITVQSDGLFTMMPLLGFVIAALCITLIELFSSKGFDILRVYQILFPVITGVFLLPTFLGSAFGPALVGALMFGFEVVNLLLLIVCAVYPARNALSPIVIYCACVGPTLFAMALGDTLGRIISPLVAYDFTYFINALFVCVYLLSIVLILISRGRKPSDSLILDELRKTSAETKAATQPPKLEEIKESEEFLCDLDETNTAGKQPDGGPTISEEDRARELAKGHGLSPREIEVMSLLIRGHSVAAISRRLYISENTTRGHTKNIYRKMSVHSKQELIDLIHPHQ